MRKFLLVFLCTCLGFYAFGQNTTTDAPEIKNWQSSIALGLNYNSNKITNPPIGLNNNQAGGNLFLNIDANYQQGKVFWNNYVDFRFGLYRIGSGTIGPGSSQKVPFSKLQDFLKVNSMYGYRLSKDSTFSIVAGVDLQTQATPSYVDSEGQVPGVFLKDIRKSSINPIRSRFFSPATVVTHISLGIRPNEKLFFSYAPFAYKGILVLDDNVAQLVGKVDANGLPIATVHGNKVEIINGQPTFKNSLHQLGSYFLATYKDAFKKGLFSVNARLELYSNYLNKPEKLDVTGQAQFNLRIIKGLNLSYSVYVFYDYDVLVQVSDDSVPFFGVSGELARKATIQRQLMLQYKIKF